MPFVVDAMAAAADFLGPGAIETPRYESEILDMVRRRGILGQRMQHVPATGQPSRYFEQTRIVAGAFQDPRNLQFNPGNDPTRRERAVPLKGLYAPVQFGLFDVEVTRQQGMFSMLVAKDVMDATQGLLRTSDLALWNGADTSLAVPVSMEYMGILKQINRTFSIASSASIIDGLKAELASLIANPFFEVQPTAVYLNPVLGDLIDQEERLNQRQIPQTTLHNVTGGLVVNALASQAGLIPLIPDWSLVNGASGGSASESGKTDYTAVIVSEALIEYHYLTQIAPRVFVLGLEGNLATRYAIVHFGAVVAKGNANATQAQNMVETGTITYSHSVGTVTK